MKLDLSHEQLTDVLYGLCRADKPYHLEHAHGTTFHVHQDASPTGIELTLNSDGTYRATAEVELPGVVFGD